MADRDQRRWLLKRQTSGLNVVMGPDGRFNGVNPGEQVWVVPESQLAGGAIPGSDPGACPRCGAWRKAGMIHNCEREGERLSRQLAGAVKALQAIAADPQIGGTGHPADVHARNALEALGHGPIWRL